MGGGENPEKTTWHTHKQNLVCVTCDCKTDQLGSNLRRSVHCLGDGCCQSDIAFFQKKKKKKKEKKRKKERKKEKKKKDFIKQDQLSNHIAA